MGTRERGKGAGHRGVEPVALRHAGLILFLGIGLTAAIAVVGVVWAPEWWFLAAEPGTKADALTAHRQAIRETSVRLATGVGAAVAGILAWGRLELSRKEHRGAERAQNTDRYTRAVEQLGHASDDVVLGGLYSLESLGKDSPADRATITEVLSAFVREHGNAEFAEEHRRQPTKVQTALTILGRTMWHPAELTGALLPQARMSSVDLTGANLNAANLTGVTLDSAVLDEAHLVSTNLTGAHLQGARLIRARGLLANLTSAHMHKADLTDADLKAAHLTKASLYEATLVGANLSRAELMEANLSHADLRRARLTGADLTQANLRRANLHRADLGRADLSHASLVGADLTQADLGGANIEDAKMPAGWEDVVARRPDKTKPARADTQPSPPGPSEGRSPN